MGNSITSLLYYFCLIILSGVTAQPTDITSCIGDNITYTCTVESLVHRWTFPTTSPPKVVSVTRDMLEFIAGPFTLTLVSDDNRVLVTTASVVSFAGLNGTAITCEDGLAQAAMQGFTTMVFGPPSVPGLTVVVVNLQTVSFNISPPLVARSCTLYYRITPRTSSGSVLADITMAVTDYDVNATLTESGFDLCSNVYRFTVTAITRNYYIGERSAEITAQPTFLPRQPVVSSSTSSSVSLEVTVNGRTGCTGLRLNATIAGSLGPITTEMAGFASASITITPSQKLPPGVYLCSISVMNGELLLQRRETACEIIKSASSAMMISIILIGIVGIEVVAVVVTIMIYIRKKPRYVEPEEPTEDLTYTGTEIPEHLKKTWTNVEVNSDEDDFGGAESVYSDTNTQYYAYSEAPTDYQTVLDYTTQYDDTQYNDNNDDYEYNS